MTTLHVVVGEIDMDGFLGRDAHPEKSDAGQTGVILEIRNSNLQWVDSKYPLYRWGNDENYVDIYIVKLEDDRIVELVEHEIKWIGHPLVAPYDIQKSIKNFLVHNGCVLDEGLRSGIWTVIAPDGSTWDFTTPQVKPE